MLSSVSAFRGPGAPTAKAAATLPVVTASNDRLTPNCAWSSSRHGTAASHTSACRTAGLPPSAGFDGVCFFGCRRFRRLTLISSRGATSRST